MNIQELVALAAGTTAFYGAKDVMPKSFGRGLTRATALAAGIAPYAVRSWREATNMLTSKSCMGPNATPDNPEAVRRADECIVAALAEEPYLIEVAELDVPGDEEDVATVPSQSTMLGFLARNEQRIIADKDTGDLAVPGELAVALMRRFEQRFGPYDPSAPALTIDHRLTGGRATIVPTPASSLFKDAKPRIVELPTPAGQDAAAGDKGKDSEKSSKKRGKKLGRALGSVAALAATGVAGAAMVALQLKVDEAAPEWLGKRGVRYPNFAWGAINAAAVAAVVAFDR